MMRYKMQCCNMEHVIFVSLILTLGSWLGTTMFNDRLCHVYLICTLTLSLSMVVHSSDISPRGRILEKFRALHEAG